MRKLIRCADEFAGRISGKGIYSLRVFNCDDGCRTYVNGQLVTEVGFGRDSGWIDMTDELQNGANALKFEVDNEGGGIAYGILVRKNCQIVFERVCGLAGQAGCENNRMFPKGRVREFTYTIVK